MAENRTTKGGPMTRSIVTAIVLGGLALGCAGPAKLAEKSENRLAKGDSWHAWELATRALDKAPGNTRAREAARAAATSLATDWQRRVHALADVDSLQAAEQVLEFSDFRATASRYVTVPVAPEWARDEQVLRRTAARIHDQQGAEALESGRPK